MKSRASHLFGSGFALLSMLFVAAPICALAQSTDKQKHADKPEPAKNTPVPTAKAHLRLWKVDLPDITAVRFTIAELPNATAKKGAGKEITTLGAGYQFNEYVDVPAGRCTLEAFATGQNHPFSSVPADLPMGSYTTLLVSAPLKPAAPPHTELIIDVGAVADGDPADGLAQFSVRNLAPGVHDLRVSVGDKLAAQFVEAGSYLRMAGLKPGVYEVHTTGKDAEGNAFEWTTEGNFERFHQQTLLIYPDPYGRLRPRLSVDGPIPAASPVKSSEQS